MRVDSRVVAANDALLRPTRAARVYAEISGETISGEGFVYNAKLGRFPSLKTEDNQHLFRRRDVVEFAERRRRQHDEAAAAIAG